MYVAKLITDKTDDATIFCVSRFLISLKQEADWITEEVNSKLILEIRRKLNPTEALLNEMVKQIIIDERQSSSPLVGLSSIYELLIITK